MSLAVCEAGSAECPIPLSPTRTAFTTTVRIGSEGRLRFLVDTGATYVSLPAADAQRLGLDYRKGVRGYTNTANGPAAVYRIMLDTVTLGDITLYNVTASVHEGQGLDIALLGNSFLNRTEMRREGQQLTLTKRY